MYSLASLLVATHCFCCGRTRPARADDGFGKMGDGEGTADTWCAMHWAIESEQEFLAAIQTARNRLLSNLSGMQIGCTDVGFHIVVEDLQHCKLFAEGSQLTRAMKDIAAAAHKEKVQPFHTHCSEAPTTNLKFEIWIFSSDI